jgi:hypothetical protein
VCLLDLLLRVQLNLLGSHMYLSTALGGSGGQQRQRRALSPASQARFLAALSLARV